MMRNRDDAKFLFGRLIDDAVGKSAQRMAAARAAKNHSEIGVRQNQIRRSLELGHECKPEFDIRSCRIERRGIMQLGKRERNNNDSHFNAART